MKQLIDCTFLCGAAHPTRLCGTARRDHCVRRQKALCGTPAVAGGSGAVRVVQYQEVIVAPVGCMILWGPSIYSK